MRTADVRVLQLGKYYPPFPGGMETHLKALCISLNRRVREMQVLVANDCRRSTEEDEDGIRIRRVATWYRLAGAPICPELLYRIRAFKPDIIHLHWPNPFALLAAMTAPRTCKLVVTYHSDVVRQKKWNRLFEPLLASALSRCDAIIATSARYIESSLVLRRFKDRCRVLPFGIEPERFQSTRQTADAARKIREQFTGPLVLAVGRMVYYKGFEFLIHAMRKVGGRLLLIGDGPLLSHLREKAVAHGVSDRVHFLGSVPDEQLPDFYHACDVFVLPAILRSEAFGLVQLEAMACGKAVVNTQLDSGVPYVSIHQETGLTVPPADADALAAAISQLLTQRELRETYGEAGRNRLHTMFTAEKMAGETVGLYREVCGRGELLPAAAFETTSPSVSWQRAPIPVLHSSKRSLD